MRRGPLSVPDSYDAEPGNEAERLAWYVRQGADALAKDAADQAVIVDMGAAA